MTRMSCFVPAVVAADRQTRGRARRGGSFPSVSGGLYIAGAYGRRNKTLRQQEIAARAAEAEQSKPKKINYGGLPGTKPKKRK